MTTFNALLVTNEGGEFAASFQQIDKGALPPGEVLVRVAFSSLNYKDGLAVTGRPGVIRKYPMVPGIDLAGVVEESRSSEFKPGDRVVVTGCGTSETMWGGYAELARLDAEFLVPLPESMTLKQAAGIGTAGFAAMQSILALESHGLKPGGQEVLVTGASGGVNLLGIDSSRVSNRQRRETWVRLAHDLPMNLLDRMITVEPLEKIRELGEQILAGKIRGRTVIEVNARIT